MAKVEYDKEKCMGCGACTYSDNWEMDEEGLAEPKCLEFENDSDIEEQIEVADMCPSQAIKVNK